MTVKITKLVAATQLTASSVLYGAACPANVTQIIKRAVFSNTDVAPRTITVNIVPTAGSATAANQIINARALQAGETYVSPELSGYELVPGDQIFALADVTLKVNMTVNGIQVS